MLRTNLRRPAEELWSRYMQLTEAEASFRALKSELSIRPLFHQKEPRVKAHVMVTFGYALWVTLKHLLKRRPAIVPQPRPAESTRDPMGMKALALLSTLQSADIVLPIPTAARFASVASPNPPPSRNRFCSSSVSASPNGSNSIANVV